MKRTGSIFAGLAALSMLALVLANSAQSQLGVAKNYVQVQASTPGAAQSGHMNVSGTARAGEFVGSGSGLTGLDASAISSGTLPDAALSANVARRDQSNVFSSGPNTFLGFLGVGRSFQVTGSESFGVGNNSSAFDGMYIRTGAPGLPFYGYSLGGAISAYHYVDGYDQNKWKLYQGTGIAITVDTAGRVGLGTFSPQSKLEVAAFDTPSAGAFFNSNSATDSSAVFGDATASSGNVYGGWFRSASPTGIGAFGQATSTTGLSYGGLFRSASSGGVGVQGIASASTGATAGLWGTAFSPDGAGVVGTSTATTGPSVGVWGRVASSAGYAVLGDATHTTGGSIGVFGRSAASSGTGVYGEASSPAGNGNGGRFVTQSSGGSGVLGTYLGASLSGTGVKGTGPTGVQGLASINQGYGVHGKAVNFGAVGGFFESVQGNALVAESTSDGWVAIYAKTSAAGGNAIIGESTNFGSTGQTILGANFSGSGWGVFANGRLGASGAKSFRIDHPQDPTNQYLLHYCAEGPEPKNIYDGEVVTDAQGWATITLPHYFESINKDPRIQLTVEDDSEEFIMVKSVGGVKNGQFRIRTSVPNVKVYWEVKAVRNDRWMQRHGAPVEVDKPPHAKGTYQHPELYDQPATLGENYRKPRGEPEARARR